MNKEYIEYKEYMEDADEAKDEASIELTTDEDAPVQSQLKKNLNEDMKQFTAEEHEEGFVFLIYMYNSTIFEELEKKAPGSKGDIHIIRFIILSVHMSCGGTLYDSNRHKIKKSSLKRIWATSSRNSINETYDLLTECGYIYETEEGYLMINEDIVIKGTIMHKMKELKKQDEDYTCTRVYKDAVKKLYYDTEPKKRKQLANLFKALPYINYKYNVFCSNPTETDETKLELLTWTDLAKLCGYDISQTARFKKDLWHLKINDQCVIGHFETESEKAIVVNPYIYYSGDNVDDIKGIQALFNLRNKKKK